MKKIVIFLFLVTLSSLAYSQQETKYILPVEAQVDSLLRKYVVLGITVGTHQSQIVPRTNDFYFDKGFLVVNKMFYFNLEKLVSFYVTRIPFRQSYEISFTFN